MLRSSNRKSQRKFRFRISTDAVGTAQKSAGDHSRISFGGKGILEAVTSEGALEKINERGTCVGLKMEIV